MARLQMRSVPRSSSVRHVLVALLLAWCGSVLVRGEEPKSPAVQEGPPIPIELYVSGTDPAAPAIRRSVAEVLKTFPRLKLREVDIDSAEGRTARDHVVERGPE